MRATTVTSRTPRTARTLVVASALALTSLGPRVAFAAGTPATSTTPNTASQLVMQQGSTTTTANGDYVGASSLPGLNQPYRYYIEVPPSLSRLVVDLFDADVLASATDAADERDRSLVATSGCVQYTLLNPSGTSVRQVVKGNGTCAVTINDNSGDNAWANFYDSATHSTTPAFAASSQTAAQDVGGVNLVQPSGTVSGSFLLAHIARDGSNADSGPITPSNATWTEIDQGDCNGGSCRSAVFYRIAGASEPGAYGFTWTGFSEHATGVILRYTSVDPTVPINGVALAEGLDNAPTAPNLATTVANTRVVRLFAADNTSNICPNSVATQRYCLESHATLAGAVSSAGADAALAAAGSTGTAAFGLAAGENWRALTIALNGTPANVTPTSGHWELTVSMTSAVTTSDVVNAFGLRAHNGDATAGGTELPVYAESFHIVGINDNDRSRSYDLYPYVTSGCEIDVNDFDFDNDQPDPGGGNPNTSPFGSHQLTRRGGGYSFASSSVSNDNAWLNTIVGDGVTENWPGSPYQATGYGLWTQTTTIEDYGLGNAGPIYLGNFNAASPPPTTQPQANSLRIYLPADGGGAPAKPYMVQSLTCLSNCTPAVGVTTRVRVDILVVNPTTRPIVFSTPTNIVTANVPGPAGPAAPFVVYAGGAAVSSGGSITGQPAVGAIGNVTWNPGTVAAGATASLNYQVDARPSGTGQVLAITGTPASNGTRGSWLDETAATGGAATRATQAFGPLCQLSVTSGETITPALLSSFAAYASGSGVVVEWRTASELRIVGFDLLRLDAAKGRFERLNRRPIPGEVDSPLGATYRFEDSGATAGEAQTYRLHALDADGGRQELGPFRVRAVDLTGSDRLLALHDGQGREPNPVPESIWQEERDRSGADGSEARKRHPTTSIVGAKVGVSASGLYRLTSDRLAAALELGEEEVRQRIAQGKLALSNGGRAVAWQPAVDGTAMLFYGEASASIYAAENVYVVRSGQGLPMRTAGPGPPIVPAGPVHFASTVRQEIDAFAATAVASDPESDYWYWRVLTAGDPAWDSATFDLPAADLADSASPSILRVDLRGATATGVANEHHVLLRLNGSQVGEATWQGNQAFSTRVMVPPGVLADGLNQLEVEAVIDGGVPFSIVYVDGFELTYDRLYRAVDDQLEFTGDGNPVVTVGGFSSPEIVVLDVTEPRRPDVVPYAWMPGDSSASLRPHRPSARFLAVGPRAVKAPAWVQSDYASSWRAERSGADYVVLTTAPLRAQAQALADSRARQGLAALVVEVDDLYDEWSDGSPTPHSIRSFVEDAVTRWRQPLRYLVLAGAGSFDYRDRMHQGGNLLPPLMVASPAGLFASDNALGDVRGDDGVPEVAIGRLPGETAEELAAYIQKVLAYEAASADEEWAKRFVLTADDGQESVSFAARSDALAGLLAPGFEARRVYLDPATLAAQRGELFGSLAEGASFLSYVGHGGMDRLTSEGLLTTADVGSLPHSDRLPVVFGLTCLINRFDYPGLEPLGTALVLAPGSGAVATWSATGISDNDVAQHLGEVLVPLLGRGEQRLGDLLRAALRASALRGSQVWMRQTYELLGDPALQIKGVPPPPPPPGGGAGG